MAAPSPEATLAEWPAERVLPGATKGTVGVLRLTRDRCYFVPRRSRFGVRRATPEDEFSRSLRDVRSVESRSFSMSIGYGDRVEIPGVAIDGTEFRLGRELSATSVVAAIGEARRVALGRTRDAESP